MKKNQIEIQTMSLAIIIGPMFSSKSTYIMHKLVQYSHRGEKVCYVNHASDQKRKQKVPGFSTHNVLLQPKMGELDIDFLQMGDTLCLDTLLNYDVIGIDEGQFYDTSLLVVVPMLALCGKKVFVCGLDGNGNQKPINHLVSLIPHANKVKKLHAICKCGQNASFTIKHTESEETIGGAELYASVCRKCLDEFYENKQ